MGLKGECNVLLELSILFHLFFLNFLLTIAEIFLVWRGSILFCCVLKCNCVCVCEIVGTASPQLLVLESSSLVDALVWCIRLTLHGWDECQWSLNHGDNGAYPLRHSYTVYFLDFFLYAVVIISQGGRFELVLFLLVFILHIISRKTFCWPSADLRKFLLSF